MATLLSSRFLLPLRPAIMAAASAAGSALLSFNAAGISHRKISNFRQVSLPAKIPTSLDLQCRSLRYSSSSGTSSHSLLTIFGLLGWTPLARIDKFFRVFFFFFLELCWLWFHHALCMIPWPDMYLDGKCFSLCGSCNSVCVCVFCTVSSYNSCSVKIRYFRFLNFALRDGSGWIIG